MTLSPDDQVLAQNLRDEIRRRELARGFTSYLEHETGGQPTRAPVAQPQDDDQLTLDLGANT